MVLVEAGEEREEQGGSSCTQLGSGCGEGPTKTPGLLKPPWMSPRGAAERTECRPGFRGSGVRPVVNELTPLGLSGSEPLRRCCPTSHASAATASSSQPQRQDREH